MNTENTSNVSETTATVVTPVEVKAKGKPGRKAIAVIVPTTKTFTMVTAIEKNKGNCCELNTRNGINAKVKTGDIVIVGKVETGKVGRPSFIYQTKEKFDEAQAKASVKVSDVSATTSEVPAPVVAEEVVAEAVAA